MATVKPLLPRAGVPDGEEHALGVTTMAWSNASSVV
jgi:hypothetical protein